MEKLESPFANRLIDLIQRLKTTEARLENLIQGEISDIFQLPTNTSGDRNGWIDDVLRKLNSPQAPLTSRQVAMLEEVLSVLAKYRREVAALEQQVESMRKDINPFRGLPMRFKAELTALIRRSHESSRHTAYLPNDGQHRIVNEAIDDSIQRSGEVMSNLLAALKPGRKCLETTRMNQQGFQHLMEPMVNRLKRFYGERLVLKNAGTSFTVTCVPHQIQRSVERMISEAVKQSDPSSPLCVQTFDQGRTVQLRVASRTHQGTELTLALELEKAIS